MHLKKYLYILFFITLTLPIKTQENNDAFFYNKKADALLLENNFSQALLELEKAEKLNSLYGYFATKIGYTYAWRLKDFKQAIPHFERALKQGGDTKPWTLREYGYSLMMINDFDTAEEFMQMAIDKSNNPKEKIDSYGYLSTLLKKSRRFEESIDVSKKGLDLNIEPNHYFLCDSIVSSYINLAHISIANKKYSDAILFYKQSEDYSTRNSIISNWFNKLEIPTQREIIEERIRIGNIKPIYENKILSLFIKNTDVKFKALNGVTLQGKSSITDDEIKIALLYQKVLKEFVESMSEGKYSISFDNKFIDSTLYDIKVSSFGGLDTREPVFETIYPPIADQFFQNRNKYDTFAIYWNGIGISTTANGGGFSYPYINYQMYSQNRGYMSFPTNWSDESLAISTSHEFFHNIESLTGITPTHGFDNHNRKSFPEWKGDGQLNYFRWQFQNSLPKILNDRILKEGQPDWNNLGWLYRFPDYFKREDYEYNKSIISKISEDNLKKSHEFALQAYTLYWEQGNKEKADPLFKKAFVLNPYNKHALRYMGDTEIGSKNFDLALQYFTTLSKVTPESWIFRMIIKIQQGDLKDYKGAIESYNKFFERFPNEKVNHIVQYGRALYEVGRYDDALDIFELGLDSKDKSQNPSVKAQCYFWKGFILGEHKGDTQSAGKLIKIGVDEGFKDNYTIFYLKKYSK